VQSRVPFFCRSVALLNRPAVLRFLLGRVAAVIFAIHFNIEQIIR
jgi:hypothetical protein